MLIDKNSLPAPGDIVSFKIVSGDEIVGKLVSIDATNVVVGRPIVVGVQMVGPSQAQIGFMPFTASTSDEGNISFFVSNLLHKPVKTREDVAANYVRATTGIALPTAQQTAGIIRG